MKYLRENVAVANEIEKKIRDLLLVQHQNPEEVSANPVIAEFEPSEDELDALSLNDEE